MSPTGACSAPRGPAVRHRRRQGHPIGGLPRRGHHHHGGGGGPPGPAVGPRGGPTPSGSPPPRRLPGQDQRHRHPLGPAPAVPCGRLRLRRRPPVGLGALRSSLAAAGTGTTLVVLSDLRDGLPTSGDESAGGDGAAAILVGDDAPGHAGDRRVPGRRLGERRVPRPLAHRRRPAVQGMGGAVRRDPVRPPRRRGLGVGPEDDRGSPPTRSTGWPSPACTAGPSRPWPASSAWATARWPTT